MQLFMKPHALTICEKVKLCMTDCILSKGFKQPPFPMVSVSLTMGFGVLHIKCAQNIFKLVNVFSPLNTGQLFINPYLLRRDDRHPCKICVSISCLMSWTLQVFASVLSLVWNSSIISPRVCFACRNLYMSSFPVVSVSLTMGCDVGCQNIPALTATRPGWVTENEVRDSSVSGSITSFLPLICMQDWPHFAAQHNVK